MMSKLCAIVVSYHPDASLIENINALLAEVEEVIIVDNGSGGEAKTRISQLEQGRSLTVIQNESNLGIATALNQGVRYALSKNYDWIATFDQDSLITPGFFQKMRLAYQTCPFQQQVALITPIYFDPGTQAFTKSRKCTGTTPYAEIIANMTSGTLIKKEIFQTVGFFKEDYFVDYVDYEFCLRVRKHGFRILQACGAVLNHQRGHMTKHQILSKPLLTSNHPPVRRYYNARNRMLFYKSYWKQEPIFLIRDFIDFSYDVIKIILLEADKSAKLKKLFLGIWHGIVGKTGPYGR
ncbi:glycosyltransferase family 2 protein [Deltaproteobacteria bacterium TL4]